MKDKIFGVLQRVGRSFMLPIAILPVAGLLLGIGGSFTNETMLETYGLTGIMGPGTILNAIFLVMLNGATTSVCGITSLQMGVFGGIIVGLGVAALHNRFYKIELPQVLSFFGGTRFVPIISSLVYVVVGILMFFIWPVIQNGIYAVGDLVLNSGYAGTWVYGFMERLLIPFGLHHVFYLPFWQTGVGGTLEVGGQLIEGAQNIFFAQLADPTVEKFAVSATRFMSGKFPLMIFGLPGAALAMYKTAKPEKKKEVGGLLLSAALTSMLTGITEPLEFTFLFVAPLLYGIHCVFAGLAYMLMHVFEVGVGMTFSGGLIDMFLFGILQGNAKTNWVWIVIVGIFYFIIYYLLFSFLIKKMDLKTPGRGEEDEEVKLYRRSDVDARKNGAAAGEGTAAGEDALSMKICQGLGGKKNISDLDCCATRLRCTVHKPELVSDDMLKATGASGVVHKGNGVQIIYGPRVTVVKSNLEDYLETAPDEEYIPEAVENAETEGAAEVKENAGTKVVKTVTISSPITGKAGDITSTPDEVFSNKMLGDGAAVTPEDAIVRAPEDGEVAFVFDTKHAVGFLTDTGISLLIHVGIDTVKLEGQGFESLVETGQKVKKGEPLLKLDLDFLKANAPSIVSPVICSEMEDNQKIRLLKQGDIKAGEELFAVDFFE